MRLFMLTAAVLAALVSPVFAQATGQINGVVTDSSGAVVPGATVTAIEQQTGKDPRAGPDIGDCGRLFG